MSRVCHALCHITWKKGSPLGCFWKKCAHKSRVTYAWHTRSFFENLIQRKYVTRMSHVCHWKKKVCPRGCFWKKYAHDISVTYAWHTRDIRAPSLRIWSKKSMSRVCHTYVTRMSRHLEKKASPTGCFWKKVCHTIRHAFRHTFRHTLYLINSGSVYVT